MHSTSLNNIHRVVWCDARNMWVAVAEIAKGRGKGGRVSKVAAAVAAALGVLSSGSAYAICNGGVPITSAVTVSTAETGPCTIGANGDLTISSSGAITGTADLVSASGISTSGGVANSGVISDITGGGHGILFKNSTVGGEVSNSGTIRGHNANGIMLTETNMTGGITNSSGGLIDSNNHGIFFAHSTMGGVIDNDGTISALGGAIHLNAVIPTTGPGSTIGGINNHLGATITGTSSGINIATNSAVTGSIANSGTIRGVKYTGLYLNNSAVNGGVVNSGMISGGSNAIHLKSSASVSGGITNMAAGQIINTGAYGGYQRALGFRVASTVNGGINNAGTISAIATGTGEAIYINSSTINDGITNSGTIAGGAYGIHLLTNGVVNGSVSNSGTISGGTKAIFVEAGSIIDSILITGNNTAKFIGEVDAINTPVTVASGATYTMDNGQLFTLNGTSSGFNVAGTLGVVAGGTGTVTGNYTQDSTGVFRTNVIDATTYGKLVVSGSATLASSARIQVGLDSGTTLANGDSLQDVISAGTLTQSAFSVGDNSMAINFNAVNDGANHIDLTAVATGMTTVTAAVQSAGMSSQIGAAGVLDSLMANPAGQSKEITDFLYSVTSSGTPQDVANVVGQVMPLLNGGVTQSTFAAMHAVNDAIQARHESGSGVSSGDAVAGGDRYFWAKPFGSLAGQDNRSGAAGYDASTYGLVIGADTVVSNTDRVGSAFAYSSTNVDGNTTAAMHNAEIDSYQITLYGSHDLSVDTNINYQVDIGQHSNRSSRNMENLGLVATADFKSTSAHVGIDVAKTMALGTQTTFTPSVSADYSGINVHGYTETGALGWNQTVDKVTADELVIGVDGKLTRDLSDTSSLSGNLGFGYDLLGEQNSITASFAGEPGAIFTTLGIDPSPWLTRGGMGFVTKMTSGMEVSARYDVEYREDFLNQSASVKLRWAF